MEQNFDILYKNYFPRVQDYLSRFTGRDEAQDLTQEVFIRVYNSLSTFKGESEVSTWIFRIARNLAIDRFRSSRMKNLESKSTSLDYVSPLKTAQPHQEDKSSDIEYNFFKDEMNQCIADYINGLPELYRSVFILSEYEKLSDKEISEILELSVENVKVRIHRARKKLHDLLMKNCNFYYDKYSQLCCDKK
jgi:RNA polymerase sigma-70 factor (ECF subfamily)